MGCNIRNPVGKIIPAGFYFFKFQHESKERKKLCKALDSLKV